ncbi:MAG TPA: SRPBCC family protein, partial [Candidatus Thermoplasmatota archaeon]
MTENKTTDTTASQHESSGPITVQAALEVNRPVAVCYDQLLRVEELPRFLGGIQHVKRMGKSITRWVATNEPTGQPWTVEIHDLVEDQRFAWRRIDGPHHEAHVQLAAVSPDRTRVNLVRKYDASGVPMPVELLVTPQARVEEDLHRFKRLVEAQPVQASDRPRRVDLRCALIG